MTHTLHRKGDRKNLCNDYVILAISAQAVNAKGSASKFKRFLDIVLKYNPINYGDMRTGNKFDTSKKKIKFGMADNSIVHAVFTNEKIFQKALKEVKEADLGLSIVCEGILDKVDELAKEIGINRHTIEYSLGILGKINRLPEQKILEITTMCGHGMISTNLVKKVVSDVKKGKSSPREAAEKLAVNCCCGVFNPVRAAEIIEDLIKV